MLQVDQEDQEVQAALVDHPAHTIPANQEVPVLRVPPALPERPVDQVIYRT